VEPAIRNRAGSNGVEVVIAGDSFADRCATVVGTRIMERDATASTSDASSSAARAGLFISSPVLTSGRLRNPSYGARRVWPMRREYYRAPSSHGKKRLLRGGVGSRAVGRAEVACIPRGCWTAGESETPVARFSRRGVVKWKPTLRGW